MRLETSIRLVLATRLHDSPVEYDFPHESRIPDVPKIRNDYYLSVMDGEEPTFLLLLWTKNYTYGMQIVVKFHWYPRPTAMMTYSASVAWSEDAKTIAAGYRSSVIELYDAETFKRVRCLEGHGRRIGHIAWNSHMLTSGSCDRSIINHDGVQACDWL